MYKNESEREYSLVTLEAELSRRKEKIEGAIAPEVADIMTDIRSMAVGAILNVESTVNGENGQPAIYLCITREREDIFTIFTCYVDLSNHVRGQCLGDGGEIPLGMGFMALGGNSAAPASGFASLRHQLIFR